MTGVLRVMVVDDHPLFRDGLAALLGSVEGMVVVGTAADGQQAVDLADREAPEVVLMDIQMPVMDGIEATRRIVDAHPGIGIVVLTMSEEDVMVFAAVRAGARGYLLKGAGQDDVVRALQVVAAGGALFGPSVALRIAKFFHRPPVTPEVLFPELTDREREVLDLMAAGKANPAIASALYLSPKTVRNNVSAILAKLQAVDRAEAIIRARDAGLGR